jgi:uncharacterized protein YacL
MNLNRLIWICTTVLFGFIGFLLGLSLGRLYVEQVGVLGSSSRYLIVTTLTIGGGIVFARLGSWLSDRYLIGSLSQFQKVSAADRVLGIVGVLLGVIFAVLVTFPLPNVPLWWLPIKLCAMAVGGVFGMALLQGMRDEMLHVFPQLDDEHNLHGGSHRSPKLLDTNIIIDGRMTDMCKTGFIEGPLFVPSFVLEEVQYIADSSDSLKRARGRRGLDVLNAMRELKTPIPVGGNEAQAVPLVQVLTNIPASVRKISSVDSKLVGLAKEMKAAIVTNDYNLNRVAELQGVIVLNINELVHALRPVVLPGEEMNLMISREGKEAGQGVGYLDDGTMVVVTDGKRYIGETCKVVISSVIQTVAGKMIFAEIKGPKGSGDDLFDDTNRRSTSPNGNGGDSGHRSGGGLRRKGRSSG